MDWFRQNPRKVKNVNKITTFARQFAVHLKFELDRWYIVIETAACVSLTDLMWTIDHKLFLLQFMSCSSASDSLRTNVSTHVLTWKLNLNHPKCCCCFYVWQTDETNTNNDIKANMYGTGTHQKCKDVPFEASMLTLNDLNECGMHAFGTWSSTAATMSLAVLVLIILLRT